MSAVEYRFIEPLDVLLLRGNALFGEAGSYGEAQIPPWPSVAAGAIRSRMLADEGLDLNAFAQGLKPHPSLGSPATPGSFALQVFQLACQEGPDVEWLVPAPADLVIQLDAANLPRVHILSPAPLHPALACSSGLPQIAVLAQAERAKAASGWWLTQAGWQAYLQGRMPTASQLRHSSELWSFDERVGVGLSRDTRSAEDGKLFTSRAVVLKPGVGFLAGVSGAQAHTVPAHGLLRLGGDGRAATIRPAAVSWPQPDLGALLRDGRCRLVLSSPGLFNEGWLPHGFQALPDGGYRFDLHGVQGRLVAASVSRSEVASGWDLARRQPKPAQRLAPSGSVFWLDELQADEAALQRLLTQGLWSVPCEDPARRAEGFNRVALAAWPLVPAATPAPASQKLAGPAAGSVRANAAHPFNKSKKSKR